MRSCFLLSTRKKNVSTLNIHPSVLFCQTIINDFEFSQIYREIERKENISGEKCQKQKKRQEKQTNLFDRQVYTVGN